MLGFKDREVITGEKSEVYFNLHKHTFSLKQKGLVVLHADTIVLKDVAFKVSEAGRQRVLKERRKNVHAKVYGDLVESREDLTPETLERQGYRRAHYNPYNHSTFIDLATEEPIQAAETVILQNKKIYYK